MRKLQRGSCFTENYTRGNCDAARFPVTEISEVLTGPQARAVHLVEASPSRGEISEPADLVASAGAAWKVERSGTSWILAIPDVGDSMSYTSPASPALHVFLPYSAEGRSKIRVHGTKIGQTCRMTIGGKAGVEVSGTPGYFAVDSDCTVSDKAAADNK